MAGSGLLLISCLVSGVRTQSYSPLPLITQQPRDQVVTRGGAAFLSCTFSSPSPLTSRVTWYREGARLERGQTLSDGRLVLSQVTGRDSGRYYCRVTSSVGTVQSREAVITVRERQERTVSHNVICFSGYSYSKDYYKEGGYLCPSDIFYGRPKRAANTYGKWKVIVNLPDEYYAKGNIIYGLIHYGLF